LTWFDLLGYLPDTSNERPQLHPPSRNPSKPEPTRFQNLILAGSYYDFTPGWYENVGMSIFIVAVLSVVMTPMFALGFWLLRKLKQRCLTRCVQTAPQDVYNSAWGGDYFELDYRCVDQLMRVRAGLIPAGARLRGGRL
jgi:hypothetical protein